MYSRLTTSTMYGSLMNSLQSAQRNIQDLQQQIASGNKYSKLSDNPSAISRSLTVQSALNANDKYQENSQNAVTLLRHSYSALDNVLDAVQTIKNLIIQAGDAALDSSQLKDITEQIEANKKIMLDNLNTKVAGQYLFGGTDTATVPFIEKSDGSIVYQGTDDRIKYALSESLLGDVSFAGSDIVPENEDSYFICSHYVPMDWKWTGREEKVQITVGNRTLSVFIPEDWSDNDISKTNTDTVNYSDNNGYRDPNEVSGISLDDLATIVNRSLEEQGADMLVSAYIERDYDAGRQQLIIKSNTGEKVGITGWPDTDYMPVPATVTSKDFDDVEFSGDDENPSGTLKIKLNNDESTLVTVNLIEGDTVETVAEKLNSIEGVYARTSADKKSLIVSATRTGDLPADRLNVDEAQEALHYPTLTITGEGTALEVFDFNKDTGSILAKPTTRLLDQSHIDIFDYLGMETATKSREFAPGETITVEDGTQLHWRVMSGGRSVDIKLNSGDYTIDDLAERLRNAGTGWLEVTVEPGGVDVDDSWKRGTLDGEAQTERLIMRGYNGEQVIFLDMNQYNYADKLGVSTALRSDPYTSASVGRGMKCVNFPSAPCVDDNVGIQMRVQMNCGMSYDVNIKKADVVDVQTGFVDRALLMKQIVNQVNEQEGYNVMGFVQHVDSTGQNIDESCSMYFLSGEAFTVVDLPFNDPEWDDYSGGLAAQMGIHGGVTSNLKQTHVKIKDNMTFAEAYDDSDMNPDSLTFREGTVRFSNLAHSVEIDIHSDDTVKDVMDRLRIQAGDWLYVNYYDEHMGQDATRNTGDFPLISISSIDGSAVNVLDIKGHLAEDALGLSTGIQGRLNYDGDTSEDAGIMSKSWDIEGQNFDADLLNITVAGYTHTLDLRSIRDVTSNNSTSGEAKADDIAEFINARMQDFDVKAEINEDKELVVYSPRGYSIEIAFLDDVNDDFINSTPSAKAYNEKIYSDLENTSAPIKTTQTFAEAYSSFRDSTIRVYDSKNNSVDINISGTDTVETFTNKLKAAAGSWLNVEYDGSEDYPKISLSSTGNNGEAISVIDFQGHIAEDVLGISTGVQGRINPSGTGQGVMDLTWDLDNRDDFAAEEFVATIDGKNYRVDLTEIDKFVTGTTVTTENVVDFINSKLGDYDFKLAINNDKELVAYAPKGSSLEINFFNNTSKDFLGDDTCVLDRTHYRGGYNLEGQAYKSDTVDPRGVSEGLYDIGIHTQNATIRSGANTMKQNGFGVINDVMAAIEAGNRDDLLEKMLPRVDAFMDNILSVMAENGALQARYDYNNQRLVSENAIMVEEYDNLVKIDPAESISQLMVADYMYQANLAVIARLIQPSLLDFLG